MMPKKICGTPSSGLAGGGGEDVKEDDEEVGRNKSKLLFRTFLIKIYFTFHFPRAASAAALGVVVVGPTILPTVPTDEAMLIVAKPFDQQ